MALSDVYPLRMAPPCQNPMKKHTHTHAAPKLVNRPSIYTLYRPCDLGHGHDKTSQSGSTTKHNCPHNSAEAKTKSCEHESAPENVIATQQKVLSCMSVNTSTHPKNLAQWSKRVVLLHRVATHIDKDHQRQHVIGTAQDADTETMCEGAENFVNTHGGPTPGNTNRRCRIR